MKDYDKVTNDPPEVIEERWRRVIEESKKLTEWPDVDNYYDDDDD